MEDPIERKRRRAQQYQQYLAHVADQRKSTEGPEFGSMQGGRKVQKLPKTNISITRVFKQSIQDPSQKNEGE